jgi:hypothetical protein
MRPLTIAAWALFVALPLTAADDPEPPDPKANAKGKQNGPLLVRLVAKKAACELDRQGMTAEKYREAIKDGKVTPPAVDLVLELTNTSKENVRVRVAGATPVLTFHLKGPEDSSVTPRKWPRGGAKQRVQVVTLAPGKKHEIKITTLDSTDVSYSRSPAFWTEPGAHTLSVDLKTRVESGGVKGKLGQMTTLSSQEVKLSVKLK